MRSSYSTSISDQILLCFSEITKNSSEILFEVWDQGQKIGKSDAFMGLAIGEWCHHLTNRMILKT